MKAGHKTHPWTLQELEIIRANYPSGGAVACEPLLPHRSRASIQQRAHSIGCIKTPQPDICTISGCGGKSVARGWCSTHWVRWSHYGDPNYERPVIGFWDYVRKMESGCWIWAGSTKGSEPNKYGSYYFRGSSWLAHRVSWVLTYGEIPELDGCDYRGTCVLHDCDTTLCVNPEHLFLGTHKQNMEDKVEKKRDTTKHKPYCVNGHARTPENLYTSKEGLRACRTCALLRERDRQAKLRSQRTEASC